MTDAWRSCGEWGESAEVGFPIVRVSHQLYDRHTARCERQKTNQPLVLAHFPLYQHIHLVDPSLQVLDEPFTGPEQVISRTQSEVKNRNRHCNRSRHWHHYHSRLD
jgi:hypothetical protein